MKKIIFADDDPHIQDVVNLIFENEYEVTTFSSGQPILDNDFILPDLFLLDKQLSEHDGIYICQFLKSQQKTMLIPVVLISASTNLRQSAAAAGADGFIEKPFPIADLRELVALHTGS